MSYEYCGLSSEPGTFTPGTCFLRVFPVNLAVLSAPPECGLSFWGSLFPSPSAIVVVQASGRSTSSGLDLPITRWSWSLPHGGGGEIRESV